jgi:hypothetical protein
MQPRGQRLRQAIGQRVDDGSDPIEVGVSQGGEFFSDSVHRSISLCA